MGEASTRFDNVDDDMAHRVTRDATEMSVDVMLVAPLAQAGRGGAARLALLGSA